MWYVKRLIYQDSNVGEFQVSLILQKFVRNTKGAFGYDLQEVSLPKFNMFKQSGMPGGKSQYNQKETKENFEAIMHSMKEAKLLGDMEGPAEDLVNAIKKLESKNAVQEALNNKSFSKLNKSEILVIQESSTILYNVDKKLEEFQKNPTFDSDQPLANLRRKEISKNLFGYYDNELHIEDISIVLKTVADNTSSYSNIDIKGGVVSYANKQGMKFSPDELDIESAYYALQQNYKTSAPESQVNLALKNA